MRTFSRGRCLGTKERGTLATNRKWKPYCVLSNGTRVEKPSGIDPIKWDKLFVPFIFSSSLDESSSRRRVPPTTGHCLERGCTRSKTFLSCGQQSHRFHFLLSMISEQRSTKYHLASFHPDFVCSCAIFELRSAARPEWGTNGITEVMADCARSMLCQRRSQQLRHETDADVVPARRSPRNVYADTIRERVSIIYIYTCTQLSIPDYRTLLR